MERSPQLYLSEIQEMADYLLSRVETHTREDYLNDQDFRFAAERAFIIMGEAFVLLKRHHLLVSKELDDQAAVIRFRNFLVHRYWAIDNNDVWSTLITNVRPLRDAVVVLLAKLDAAQPG